MIRHLARETRVFRQTYLAFGFDLENSLPAFLWSIMDVTVGTRLKLEARLQGGNLYSSSRITSYGCLTSRGSQGCKWNFFPSQMCGWEFKERNIRRRGNNVRKSPRIVLSPFAKPIFLIRVSHRGKKKLSSGVEWKRWGSKCHGICLKMVSILIDPSEYKPKGTLEVF